MPNKNDKKLSNYDVSEDHYMIQIGIVSFGAGCGISKYPGVYTLVESKYSYNLLSFQIFLLINILILFKVGFK